MHKKGVTLIELMIVVSIISFITISTLTGFMVSSERLKFQNQLQTLESFISSHKATAFNDTTSTKTYEIAINTTEIDVTTTDKVSNNIDFNQTYTIPQEDLILEDFNVRTTNSIWTEIPAQTLQISIDSQQRICNITNGTDQYILAHIPIRKPDEATPSKHLYIHRQNCLIESLNNQIQQT